MAEEAFRLPKSSYEEVVKIIRAYSNVGDEATLPDLERTAAMNATIISSNNAFLVSLGIIEGGKTKTMTPKGKELGRALEHNQVEAISAHWRDLVLGNEFLQKMLTAVSIRQGMEISALQSHIAYSAGEQKNSRVMAGAAAIMEILKIAGLLAEQDGKLVAVQQPGASSSSARSVTDKPATLFTVTAPKKITSIPDTRTLPVSINIQIQCTATDLDGIAPKIRALLRDLAKPDETPEDGAKE